MISDSVIEQTLVSQHNPAEPYMSAKWNQKSLTHSYPDFSISRVYISETYCSPRVYLAWHI